MKHVHKINLKSNINEYGSLVPLESTKNIPFTIKRVYYIYNVPNQQKRGFHSHVNLQQVLICVHGSVKILTKTPFEENITSLSTPTDGLYIGPMIWREMYDFSADAVLLVLASEHYVEKDYIRDYSLFELLAKKYFKKV